MSDPRVLVMGFGSPLRGDDGAGAAALERLRAALAQQPGVDLVDGGVRGLDLLERAPDYDRVILIDAARAHATAPAWRAGQIVHLPSTSVRPRAGALVSLHGLDLGATLELARALHLVLPPVELVLIFVEDTGVGQPLSPSVAGALDAVVSLVKARIEEIVQAVGA